METQMAGSSITWLLVVILVSCGSCPVMGQSSIKRLVTPDDYGLWNRVKAGDLSRNGKWVSWSLQYESGMDTLFVSGTDGKGRHHFVNGKEAFFFGEDGFGCMLDGQKAVFAKLSNSQRQTYEDVEDFTAFGNFAVLLANKDSLTIIDNLGRVVADRKHCVRYAVSPKGTFLLYALDEGGNKGLHLLRIEPNGKIHDWIVAERTKFDIGTIAWSNDEMAVSVVLRQDDRETVLYYRVDDRSLRSLDTDKIPIGKHLDIDGTVLVPGDGRRIFVTLRGRLTEPQKEVVEVWNAQDKLIFPKQIETNGWLLAPMVAMWDTATGAFVQITDQQLPKCSITADGRHALLWNPVDYEPQYEFIAPLDVYLMDLVIMEKKLLLKKQGNYSDEWCISPKGRHITYFKDGCWWDYDIAADSHINLSFLLTEPTFKNELGRKSPFSRVVWDKNEHFVLLCDAFDVWLIDVETKVAKRITNGRENGKVFRILNQPNASATKSVFDGWQSGAADFGQTVLLGCTSSDLSSSGLYKWHLGSEPKLVSHDDTRHFDVLTKGNIVTWFSETYERPAELFAKKEKRKPIRLAQTMPYAKHFLWGKAERIEYKCGEDNLGGILYYPAGFDSSKTYPMVVQVYEKFSQRLRFYVNPSAYSGGNLNVSNMTSKGYFVLCPDIVYESGKPGASAVRCVEAAVDAALEIAPIDNARIGLSGYSFGGFEANYIATHCKRFAAIASGAGFSDFVSAYHAVAANYGVPEFFRFETFQNRMGSSFADSKQGYIDNSPLFNAEDVATPLLLFVGGKDMQIRPEQSLAFHLALRRLGKENVLLWYPEEGHAFSSKESQADLSGKLEAWFDHYLLGKPKQEWMIPK